jgi:hypothetical protein
MCGVLLPHPLCIFIIAALSMTEIVMYVGNGFHCGSWVVLGVEEVVMGRQLWL